jgi:putative tricarboxylic transport membrane protein
MLLVLNLPLIKLWVRLLEIPRPLLYTAIVVSATLGVYAEANSTTNLLIMYAIGAMGFFMRRYDIPIGPMILAVILGPLMEAQFRRAMSISQGDMTIFFERPVSATILGVAVLAIVAPYLPALVATLRGRRQDAHRLVLGSDSEE